MIRTPEEDLRRELQDPEYALLYGAADAKNEVAIALAAGREAGRKTQQQLADAIRRSQPYIAQLESGDANPTVGTIGSILALLGYRMSIQIVPLLQDRTPATIERTNIPAANPEPLAAWGGWFENDALPNAGAIFSSVAASRQPSESPKQLVGAA